MILFLIFCVPAVIAWRRNLSSRTAIVIFSILNALFAEFTSIWGLWVGVILLIWSLIGSTNEANNVTGIEQKDQPELPKEEEEQSEFIKQLIKVAEMKEKGLLSNEEYELLKQEVLKNGSLDNVNDNVHESKESVSVCDSSLNTEEMSRQKPLNSGCEERQQIEQSFYKNISTILMYLYSKMKGYIIVSLICLTIIFLNVVVYDLVTGSESFGKSNDNVTYFHDLPNYTLIYTETPKVTPGERVSPGQNLVYKISIDNYISRDSLEMLQDFFIDKGEKEFVGINKILVHVYLNGKYWKPIPDAALNYICKEKEIIINDPFWELYLRKIAPSIQEP